LCALLKPGQTKTETHSNDERFIVAVADIKRPDGDADSARRFRIPRPGGAGKRDRRILILPCFTASEDL
jgi:hypothetical protein